MTVESLVTHPIVMPHVEREATGLRGRNKVEREFEEKIVIGKYL